MTSKEQTYVAVLAHWYKHRKDPPSLPQLAALIRPPKSITAIRVALINAENKGYVKRDQYGQFRLVP